jgi:CDP-diacylglycerol--glycerol-3-phosphate 3-phosphatidyltransferase
MKWNAPNIITLSRIALIPFFMLCMYSGLAYMRWAAVAIFAIASLTDGIDGYLARKYNQVTTFGKFIDPLADKLLVISALLLFVEFGNMSAVSAMIIIMRELCVTSLRTVAMGQGIEMAAGFSGKVKTFTQILCIILMLTPFGALHLFNLGSVAVNIDFLMVFIMVIVTIWSGVDYFWQYRKVFEEKA